MPLFAGRWCEPADQYLVNVTFLSRRAPPCGAGQRTPPHLQGTISTRNPAYTVAPRAGGKSSQRCLALQVPPIQPHFKSGYRRSPPVTATTRLGALPPRVLGSRTTNETGPPIGRSCLKAKKANVLKSISSIISLRCDPVLTFFKWFVHALKGDRFMRSIAVSESSLREHRRKLLQSQISFPASRPYFTLRKIIDRPQSGQNGLAGPRISLMNRCQSCGNRSRGQLSKA